jgi:mannose-1-phosphate guanylyltransferase/mannose-6-phosphate isomerase
MSQVVSLAGVAPGRSADQRRYAVVLAGGSGTRLWPLSRSSMPKQLLALNGSESLMQQTVRRVTPRVGGSRIFTVTHADHRFEVMGQLHALDARLADNVLAEPMGRNTLPAIAWAVARIAREAPDAVIGVFSSDHAVADSPAFIAAWAAAEAAADDGYIVLFGMKPTEPATGFGYIHGGEPLSARAGDGVVRRVKGFVEKPNRETAERFLATGEYYWNGGMFVFRADRFLDALRQWQPRIHAAVDKLAECDRQAPEAL